MTAQIFHVGFTLNPHKNLGISYGNKIFPQIYKDLSSLYPKVVEMRRYREIMNYTTGLMEHVYLQDKMDYSKYIPYSAYADYVEQLSNFSSLESYLLIRINHFADDYKNWDNVL